MNYTGATFHICRNLRTRSFFDAVEACDHRDGVLASWCIGDTISHWAFTILESNGSGMCCCRVISAEHRKNDSGLKHEYLQLTLLFTGQNRTYIRYARIDHSFQRNPKETQKHFRAVFRDGNLNPMAEDTIIITPTPLLTDSVSLYEIYFDLEQAPTIIDLAIVLKAVTSFARRDPLNTFLCYLHARLLFEGLACTFQGRVQEGNVSQLRGNFGSLLGAIDASGRIILVKMNLCSRISNIYELLTLSEVLGRISSIRAERTRLDPVNAEVASKVKHMQVRFLFKSMQRPTDIYS